MPAVITTTTTQLNTRIDIEPLINVSNSSAGITPSIKARLDRVTNLVKSFPTMGELDGTSYDFYSFKQLSNKLIQGHNTALLQVTAVNNKLTLATLDDTGVNGRPDRAWSSNHLRAVASGYAESFPRPETDPLRGKLTWSQAYVAGVIPKFLDELTRYSNELIANMKGVTYPDPIGGPFLLDKDTVNGRARYVNDGGNNNVLDDTELIYDDSRVPPRYILRNASGQVIGLGPADGSLGPITMIDPVPAKVPSFILDGDEPAAGRYVKIYPIFARPLPSSLAYLDDYDENFYVNLGNPNDPSDDVYIVKDPSGKWITVAKDGTILFEDGTGTDPTGTWTDPNPITVPPGPTPPTLKVPGMVDIIGPPTGPDYEAVPPTTKSWPVTVPPTVVGPPIDNIPVKPPLGDPPTLVPNPKIVSSAFELSLNAETNGSNRTIDLIGVISPALAIKPGFALHDERNKRVTILRVNKTRAKVGYWARWMWALMSGSASANVIQVLGDQGLLTINSSWPDTNFWLGHWGDWRDPWIAANSTYVGWTWDQWKAQFLTGTDEYEKTHWNVSAIKALPCGLTDQVYWDTDQVSAGLGPRRYSTSNNSITNHSAYGIGYSSLLNTDNKGRKLWEYLPTDFINTDNYTWNNLTKRHTHKSPEGKFLVGSSYGTTSDSIYVSSGQALYNVELVIGGWNGYAKPFTMVDSPMRVLYNLNPNPYPVPVGSPPVFSAKSVANSIFRGGLPPVISIPPAFILS